MTTVEGSPALKLNMGNALRPALRRTFSGMNGMLLGHLSMQLHRGSFAFSPEPLTLPVGVTREAINRFKLPRDRDKYQEAVATNARREELFTGWLGDATLPSLAPGKRKWGAREIGIMVAALDPHVTYLHFLRTPGDVIGTLYVELD